MGVVMRMSGFFLDPPLVPRLLADNVRIKTLYCFIKIEQSER